jgi:hypothetical protein
MPLGSGLMRQSATWNVLSSSVFKNSLTSFSKEMKFNAIFSSYSSLDCIN